MHEAVQDSKQSHIAMMPCLPPHEMPLSLSKCDKRVVFLHAKYGAAAEQFRRMGSRLAYRHPAGGTLMITSPAPEDGKTLTAINFALCLAERAPVLLVDLDTRRPTVPLKLGLPPADHGIEDVLLGRRSPESCLIGIEDTNLSLALNSGQGRDVVDLMATGRLKSFLDWAQRRFSWVVLDTPPIFPIADTLEISNHTSLGVLIVRARKTPVPLVKRSLEALRGRLQYVVLNDSETSRYSGYEYDNYYYSTTREGGEKRS